MITQYYPIPEKTKLLFLDHWWDFHELYQISIRAITDDNVDALLVWQSNKYSSYNIKGLIEELKSACEVYGIIPKFGNDFWEWRGCREF